MKALRSLIDWIDKDWERLRFNPVSLFAQKLLWCVPILVVGIVGYIAGTAPGDVLYDWGLPIGIVLSLLLFGLSMYRGLRGYSRTDWQEAQARRRRGE